MIIDNLTTPGASPSNSDLIRYTHANGIIEEKRFICLPSEAKQTQATTYTRADIMRRFTDTELIGILTGAKNDVVIELFLMKLDAFQDSIELDSDEITEGLTYLVTNEYITAARMAEIAATT